MIKAIANGGFGNIIEASLPANSYARREQKEESDLDLLVEFNGRIGLRFIDLAEELKNLIGFKVNQVSRKRIKDKYY